MPTRDYSKASKTPNAFVPGLGAARAGLAIGRYSLIGTGVFMLIIAVVLLFVVPFPYNVFSAVGLLVITAVSTLPFLGSALAGLMKGFGLTGNSSAGALRFWGCPGGLVYMQGRQISTLRWDNLAQVWRKPAMVNGVLTTIGYAVQPANAQPFEFSLLGGPYAGLMSAFGGAGSVKASRRGRVKSRTMAGLPRFPAMPTFRPTRAWAM